MRAVDTRGALNVFGQVLRATAPSWGRSECAPTDAAQPKSISVQELALGSHSTFEGFKSRWHSAWLCSFSSFSATCRRTKIAVGKSGATRDTHSFRACMRTGHQRRRGAELTNKTVPKRVTVGREHDRVTAFAPGRKWQQLSGQGPPEFSIASALWECDAHTSEGAP